MEGEKVHLECTFSPFLICHIRVMVYICTCRIRMCIVLIWNKVLINILKKALSGTGI